MRAAPKSQFTAAHRTGDLDLIVGVHCEGCHAVDVFGLEARVIDRALYGLRCKGKLGYARALAELGVVRSDDNRLVFDVRNHGYSSFGRVS